MSSLVTRAPVHSMTGYAQTQQAGDAGEITVSLRAVNGRGLDLHFHMSSELGPLENDFRTLLRTRIARGNVEIRIAFAEKREDRGAVYNEALFETYLGAFKAARKRFGLVGEPDLTQLLLAPGMFAPSMTNGKGERAELPGTEIVAALAQCIDELNRVRAREGEALAAAIASEVTALEDGTRKLRVLHTGVAQAMQARLAERIAALLGNASTLTPGRLAEEAAILADRADIEEELKRLEIHEGELRRLLEEGGQTGKRIDFLMQEINREVNTVLSKVSSLGEAGLGLTAIGLDAKARVDRIREQAANLE